MRSALLLVLLPLAAAGSLGLGTVEEFWSDFFEHGGYSMELIIVDYSSGGPELCSLRSCVDELETLGVAGRFPAGMGAYGIGGTPTNCKSFVYEVPGEGGWDLAVAVDGYDMEPLAVIADPGEDLQPAVFGNRCLAFSRENSDGGFDIALWSEDSGVRILDLGPGDQLWPTFFYAASKDELVPAGYGLGFPELSPGELDPLRKPVILVYQDNIEGFYRLYFSIVNPGGVVERSGEISGLEAVTETLCPELPNHYPTGFDYLDDYAPPLAFHSPDDGDRDIYLAWLSADDEGMKGLRLVARDIRRLTDWPGEEKFPELYAGYDWEAKETATWCFFAADRDGDWDVYALWVEENHFYQLTDLPGTQTAPLVLTSP